MIIQAYSMDQVADAMRDALNDIERGSRGHWEGPARKRYYSGRELSLDRISNDIMPTGSKFYHYIQQASSNGTLIQIEQYVDPLAASVYVERRNRDHWLRVRIFDTGTVASIAKRENPKILSRYLPEEIRAIYASVPSMLKTELELYRRYCHNECGWVRDEGEMLWGLARSMERL